MFTLSHDSENLSLDLFTGQRFGAGLASTGQENSSRNRSSKAVGIIPDEPNDSEPIDVPKPATAIALGLFATGCLVMNKKNKAE